VLVGHSFGGFNIRVFNKLYPADVAAVVLVDAAHEDEDARRPSSIVGALVNTRKADRCPGHTSVCGMICRVLVVRC